jgi:hypothetical protein
MHRTNKGLKQGLKRHGAGPDYSGHIANTRQASLDNLNDVDSFLLRQARIAAVSL